MAATSTQLQLPGDYFELDSESPYMLLAAPVKHERRIPLTEEQSRVSGLEQLKVVRSEIPAVTHVNYSARVQTVTRETSPDYYDLISEFDKLTGCPVMINTSFNVRGEPIVCTPEDAYRCFMRTEMDSLVLGGHLLSKCDQPPWPEDTCWREDYVLD